MRSNLFSQTLNALEASNAQRTLELLKEAHRQADQEHEQHQRELEAASSSYAP